MLSKCSSCSSLVVIHNIQTDSHSSITSVTFDDDGSSSAGNGNKSSVRLKTRLPKAEVARLMEESKDEAEAAQKIMDLCLANNNANKNNIGQQQQLQLRLKSGHEMATQGFKLT
ncbi:hypothetical protein QQ045_020295 [Rhodiola kirilowii]